MKKNVSVSMEEEVFRRLEALQELMAAPLGCEELSKSLVIRALINAEYRRQQEDEELGRE